MHRRLLSTSLFVLALLAWRLPSWQASGLALLLALLPVWLSRSGSRRLAPLALALLLGFGRAALDDATQARPPGKVGRSVVCAGLVVDSPRQWGSATVFFFEVDRLEGAELTKPLLLLVRWSGAEDVVAPGERWELSGRWEDGEEASYPGGFSSRRWLWTQRAQGVLRVSRFSEASYLAPPRGWGPSALAARLRVVMLSRLTRIADPTARALVAGVVFGDTQALPKEVQVQFRRTGTSHLLAASGMNVALLLGLCLAAAKLLGYGPWRVAPALIPIAIGYAYLAGCAPSISRAAAAAVMGLLAAWWGRSSSAWNSLCLSVWILLLWEPRQVYDPGFQLSVAAVVGLIAGPTTDDSAPSWKKNSLMTVSACLLTLPIMWTMFHEFSLTLLPANLILGPLVELLFPLGLLLTLLPLSPLVWLTEKIAQLSLWLVALLSKIADPIPLAQPGALSLALLGGAILLWVGTWSRARWLALPLAFLALLHGQVVAGLPAVLPGELLVRRIGEEKPVFWVSCEAGEELVLSESWQETRARAMLLDLGCRRKPRVKVLGQEERFERPWGVFRWGKVAPLLPKAPYLELRTTGSTYTVRHWRPR